MAVLLNNKLFLHLHNSNIWAHKPAVCSLCECVVPWQCVWASWGLAVSARGSQWACSCCCTGLAALWLWWCEDCPSRSVYRWLLATDEEPQTETHRHTVSTSCWYHYCSTWLYNILYIWPCPGSSWWFCRSCCAGRWFDGARCRRWAAPPAPAASRERPSSQLLAGTSWSAAPRRTSTLKHTQLQHFTH